jgi:hypothetical protein
VKTLAAWIGLAVSVAFIIIAVIGLTGCHVQQCNPQVQRCSYHNGESP